MENIQKTSTGFCISENILSDDIFDNPTTSLCDDNFQCESTAQESKLPFLVQKGETSIFSDCSWNDQMNQTLFEKSNVRNYFHKTYTDKNAEIILNSHYQQCLPVRKIVQSATNVCQSNSDCFPTYFGRSLCVYPLDMKYSQTKLIVLSRSNNLSPYIFWGHPAELVGSLKLTPLQPRLGIIPTSLLNESEIVLKYLFIISMSLLFFNVIPCYPFDGYHIFDVLTILILTGRVSEVTRTRILKCLNIFSVILLLFSAFTALLFSSTIF